MSIGGGNMFNFRKGVARISSVFVILFAFLITQVYGAPAKVSTNTVAAKAAPVGAVGAKPDVVKKVAPKAPAKAVAKAPAKLIEEEKAKGVKYKEMLEKVLENIKDMENL